MLLKASASWPISSSLVFLARSEKSRRADTCWAVSVRVVMARVMPPCSQRAIAVASRKASPRASENSPKRISIAPQMLSMRLTTDSEPISSPSRYIGTATARVEPPR